MNQLFCDGGIIFNPDKKTGQICFGFVLKENNKIIFQNAEYQIDGTTPIAEYLAVISGLKKAIEMKIKDIEVFSDSRLVINQITKKWRVYEKTLKGLNFDVQFFSKQFDKISFSWIPREENRETDFIVSEKLKFYRKGKNAIITN